MTIATKESVRAAIDRALRLDPHEDTDSAIATVAQAMCLPVELVREIVEQEPTCED